MERGMEEEERREGVISLVPGGCHGCKGIVSSRRRKRFSPAESGIKEWKNTLIWRWWYSPDREGRPSLGGVRDKEKHHTHNANHNQTQRAVFNLNSLTKEREREGRGGGRGALTWVLFRRSKLRLDSFFFLLWESPPPSRSSGDRLSPAPMDLSIRRRSRGADTIRGRESREQTQGWGVKHQRSSDTKHG